MNLQLLFLLSKRLLATRSLLSDEHACCLNKDGVERHTRMTCTVCQGLAEAASVRAMILHELDQAEVPYQRVMVSPIIPEQAQSMLESLEDHLFDDLGAETYACLLGHVSQRRWRYLALQGLYELRIYGTHAPAVLDQLRSMIIAHAFTIVAVDAPVAQRTLDGAGQLRVVDPDQDGMAVYSVLEGHLTWVSQTTETFWLNLVEEQKSLQEEWRDGRWEGKDDEFDARYAEVASKLAGVRVFASLLADEVETNRRAR